MVKHTDKYYIKKITQLLDDNGYKDDIKTFHTRATPKERGVYIAFNGIRRLKAGSFEQLYNEIILLLSDQL